MSNEKLMNTRVRQKIDTSENWSKAINFTPLAGEIIIYSDLKKFKVGDGISLVNELDFYNENTFYVTLSYTDDGELYSSHSPAEIDTLVKQGKVVQLKQDNSNWISALADLYIGEDDVTSYAMFAYVGEDPHTGIIYIRGDGVVTVQDNYFATPGYVDNITPLIIYIDENQEHIYEWQCQQIIEALANGQKILQLAERKSNSETKYFSQVYYDNYSDNVTNYIEFQQMACDFSTNESIVLDLISREITRTQFSPPSAGGSTESGGNIFGDAETNSAEGTYATAFGSDSNALGDNSMAIGKEVQTGCKGYYIKAIDPASRYIYLATDGVECVPTWANPSDHYDSNFNTEYTIITPEEIEAGAMPSYSNEFSISSEDYYHWVFAADIVDISGNRIQYSEKNIMSENPDKEHAAYKKWMENFEGKAKPMKFYVPTQSDAGNIVTGHYTLAVGKGSVAADDYAVAEGRYNLAVGYASHVEGDSNRAGYTSHAEGVRTQALGLGAHTEGQETIATGRFAHAQGSGSEAAGDFAHAGGFYSKATGISSCAQGSGTEASGMYANAQGVNTIASGHFSHAGGRTSIAAGEGTIAQGENPAAFAPYSVALGYKTQTGYADAEIQKEFQHLLGSLVTGESMTFEHGGEQSQIITIPLQATQVDFSYTTEEEVYLPGNDFDISLELTLQYLNEKRESIGEFKFGTNNIPTGARYMQINGQPSITGSAGFAAIHMRNISFQFTISQSVGTSSLAFGSYTAALGNHSLAGGLYTTASGSRSLAFGEGSSDDRTEATGDTSIAMGKHVKATNTGAIALGIDTRSTGEYSVALGKNTEATASHALTNGINTKATQSHAIALGSNSNAKGIASLAFGDTNNAEKAYTWALGQRNTVNAIHSLAIGRDNTTNGRFNFAFGENCLTNGDYSVAIGNGAIVDGTNGIALGSGAYAGPNEITIGSANYNKIGLFVDENANHSIDITQNAITFKGIVNESILSIGDFGITMDRTGDAVPPSISEGVIAAGGGCAATGRLSVAISDFLDATGDYSFAMGQGQPERFTETGEVIKFGAHGDYSLAFGYNVNAEGSHSLAFGDHAHASDNFALAFGAFATADAPNSVAIGGNATASGNSSFAFGDNAIAEADNAIAIGSGSKSSVPNTIAIGTNAKATVNDAIAIGSNAIANSPYTIAIGNGSNANKSFAVAIGCGNIASATGAFALGYGTTAGGKYSVTFGQNTSTAAEGAIAFGNTSKANVTSSSGAYNSLVGGYYSESSHNATIVVGNQLRSANINGAVFGQYNSIEGLGATANDRALLILGNGSSDSARSNAFVVLRDGRMILGSGSHGTTLPASGYEGQIFFLES